MTAPRTVPRGWPWLLPLLAVGAFHCTTGDLDALGAGAAAGDDGDGAAHPVGAADAGDASVHAAADASMSGSDASSMPPPVGDSGTTATNDAGDAAVDAESGTPEDAPPSFLDAGVMDWCSEHLGLGYVFCADFDETPLPAGFTASDGAFLSQTSSSPSSGPNDLLLYVPAQTGSGSFGSKLSRAFDTPASNLVLAFDLDPELLNDTAAGLLFAGLDFLGNADAKYSLRLAWNSGAPRLEESFLGTPSDIPHQNFSLALAAWSHVEVDITLPQIDGGTATPSFSILVNGIVQGTSETLSPPAGFDARPTLLVGAVYGTGPTSGWALRYDNVTLGLH